MDVRDDVAICVLCIYIKCVCMLVTHVCVCPMTTTIFHPFQIPHFFSYLSRLKKRAGGEAGGHSFIILTFFSTLFSVLFFRHSGKNSLLIAGRLLHNIQEFFFVYLPVLVLIKFINHCLFMSGKREEKKW